jgi:hypothetical protein
VETFVGKKVRESWGDNLKQKWGGGRKGKKEARSRRYCGAIQALFKALFKALPEEARVCSSRGSALQVSGPRGVEIWAELRRGDGRLGEKKNLVLLKKK